MIKFQMEQQGLTRKDLEPMIGSRARVSEVLNGKRALTFPMIRRLHGGLRIPIDLLVGVDSAVHRVRRPGAMRRKTLAVSDRKATPRRRVR